MEATEIEVNGAYAYLRMGSTKGPHEPLLATVLEEPSGGKVKVLLKHPDTGSSEELVATRELVGGWHDVPEERFAVQHQAEIEAAAANGDTWTWSHVMSRRYELVCRQRALAVRLTALGVARSRAHYAGQGGQPGNAQLQPNYNELEWLLAKAEGGAVPLPA